MNFNDAPACCPIRKEAEQAGKLGGEMLKALRKLRREMENCPHCPAYDGCPVLAEFHATVDQVILEIQEEWNLK